MRLFFLTILVALLYVPIYSSPILCSVDSENNFEFVISHVHIFEDTSNSVTIQDILNHNKNIVFTEMQENFVNLGFTQSAYWLQITIQNNTPKETGYLLQYLYPLINTISFYKTQQKYVLDSIQTGENYPHTSRIIFSNYFVFSMDVPANSEYVFYIRLYNSGETLRIPFKIEKKSARADYGNKKTFIDSLFYGYLIFAIAFNLFLFILIRRKIYFYLSAFLITMTLFLLVIQGYAFQYLWPNSPLFSNHSLVLFSQLSSFAILEFANVFLKNTRRIRIISYILIGIGISILICNYIPGILQYSVLSANLYAFITSSFILTISIIQYTKNKTLYNLIFLYSFACVIISVLIYILRNLGILGVSFITEHALKTGLALQATFISIATIIQFRDMLVETNKFLENMIGLRTKKISEQNALLHTQNKTIKNQYEEIKKSIEYAKRLQHAVLPNKYRFSSVFKDHFILFKPKDVVSGDFYWIYEKKQKTYIVAADCTGHGVPGGFLSMLGISFLNQIIIRKRDIRPHEIVNKLAILFAETIANYEDKISRDSMDISICLIHHDTNQLEYAGANNSLILIRDNTLQELSVDKRSLHKEFLTEHFSFSGKCIDLLPHDKVYLFTDGFYDQFGEQNNKRISKRLFKSLLLEHSNKPMAEQYEVFDTFFTQWKGTTEQIDDVLIIGFEL